MVKVFLRFLLLFLIILAFLCGTGIGIGFFLHWVIPSIGADVGSLIGVVSVGWATCFFTRLVSLLNQVAAEENPEDEPDLGDIETIILAPIRRRTSKKKKKR